jgi:anaerobic magnesium-protoporphyrin IX monomethyl ester cyclase
MKEKNIKRDGYVKDVKIDALFVDLWHSNNHVKEYFYSVNIGLRSILAYTLSRGYTGKILYNFDIYLPLNKILDVYIKSIINEKPLLLCFSPYSSFPIKGRLLNDIDKINRIVTSLKSYNFYPYILMGGQFASLMPNQLMHDLPWIDFIIKGEGEYSFVELLTAIKTNDEIIKINGLVYRDQHNIMEAPPPSIIENIDKLPFPSIDHLDYLKRNDLPLEPFILSTSRGCYGKCSFCSNQSFYHLSSNRCSNWRGNSPHYILDEIEFLKNNYNIKSFEILDSNFLGRGRKGHTRALNIAQEILNKKLKIKFSIMCRANDVNSDLFLTLKKAGLESVIIGIDSGSEHGLCTFNKGISLKENKNALLVLDRLKIRTIISFIFINPYSTLEVIKDNIDFYYLTSSLKYVKWENDNILSFLWIYPGTPIFESLKIDRLLCGNYYNGYYYRFKYKNMIYINKLCKLFSQTAALMDEFIYDIDIVNKKGRFNKRIENLLSYKKNICTSYAILSLEESIKILGNHHSLSIQSFLKNLKDELTQVNVNIRIQHTIFNYHYHKQKRHQLSLRS